MSKRKCLASFSLMTVILVGIVGVWQTTKSMAASQLASSTDVQAHHVFIVMLENHSYSSVIGNSSMPYLNGLAHSYAYASSYYANTHPSIGNYFELTTGKIITNDDSYT